MGRARAEPARAARTKLSEACIVIGRVGISDGIGSISSDCSLMCSASVVVKTKQ